MKNILSDFREAEIAFELDDLEEIAKAREKYLNSLSKTQTIYLVSNPKNTVFAMMVLKDYPLEIPNVKVCSGRMQAIKHLSIDITKQELNNRINNLKFEFIN